MILDTGFHFFLLLNIRITFTRQKVRILSHFRLYILIVNLITFLNGLFHDLLLLLRRGLLSFLRNCCSLLCFSSLLLFKCLLLGLLFLATFLFLASLFSHCFLHDLFLVLLFGDLFLLEKLLHPLKLLHESLIHIIVLLRLLVLTIFFRLG